MKRLWFARHAKSSWDHAEMPDIKRPLLKRGEERTLKLIQFLQAEPHRPALVYASPAVRTRETARLLAEGLGYRVADIKIVSDLYFGMEEQYWSAILGTSDAINHLLIVGHNPTITYMVNHFLLDKIDILPTSGFAAFVFDTDKWQEIPLVKPRTEHLVFPKLL